jgi:hypothetical protein
MSLTKFKKVLVYLGLSFSLLFVSVGVSNANPFTVTAVVGCDPMSDPGTSGNLGEVTTSDPLTYGSEEAPVEQGDFVNIGFTITATSPKDCAGDDAFYEDDIDINFGGVDASSLSTMDIINTASTSAIVTVTFPERRGDFSATITFAHVP